MGNEDQFYQEQETRAGSEFQEGNTQYTQAPTNGYYVPEPEEGPGYAVAGMVCGILSIVCCICFSPYLPGLLAIVGGVFSIIALVKHKPGRGMAIAGLVCSIVGILIVIFLLICSLWIMGNPDLQTPEGIQRYLNDLNS